jgi:hypothetical protein
MILVVWLVLDNRQRPVKKSAEGQSMAWSLGIRLIGVV